MPFTYQMEPWPFDQTPPERRRYQPRARQELGGAGEMRMALDGPQSAVVNALVDLGYRRALCGFDGGYGRGGGWVMGAENWGEVWTPIDALLGELAWAEAGAAGKLAGLLAEPCVSRFIGGFETSCYVYGAFWRDFATGVLIETSSLPERPPFGVIEIDWQG